jgi:hypothetical protein
VFFEDRFGPANLIRSLIHAAFVTGLWEARYAHGSNNQERRCRYCTGDDRDRGRICGGTCCYFDHHGLFEFGNSDIDHDHGYGPDHHDDRYAGRDNDHADDANRDDLCGNDFVFAGAGGLRAERDQLTGRVEQYGDF